MYVLVSYDIVDNKMRTKTAKTMEDYGRRVQKSVFECRIDEGRYVEMKEKLESLIDMEQDSVRYYVICARCVQRIEVSGIGTVTEDEQLVIV